jgi:hypothetical protein
MQLSLVERLRIKGSFSKLSVSTTNAKDIEKPGLKVDFKIAPIDDMNDQGINVCDAWAINDLNIPLKRYSTACRDVRQWPHLADIPFPDVERKKISVLIGTNIPEAFIPLEVKKGMPNEPLAIKSCLGWSVLGNCNMSSGSSKSRAQLNHVLIQEELSLDKQLEHFWMTESYGSTKVESKPMSVEDQYAQRVIESTISKVGGHYQMGLLWKKQDPRLPCNRTLAEVRLNHLKKRLRRDPDLKKRYRAVIDDYVMKGYARRMTKEEASARSDITWYLPHHPVFNPNKPGKVRVVFDAAAKFQDTSLNDQLLQGPDLTNELVGVLMRFRQNKIAYAADIEAMFHQTRVIPKDTDALRFLWWSGSIDDPPEDYQMLVHIFGATSSPCCANKALRQTADDNERYFDPEVIQTLRRNFYVDDNLKSVSTVQKAVWLVGQLTKLLAEGGFHLTKFISNNRDVLASISPEERANPTLNLDLDELPIERVLGLQWDAESDMFQFKTISVNKPYTKRGILSVVSSLYDPLGFLSPLTFLAKVLLQNLWRIGAQWDEEIHDPFLLQWKEWIEELKNIRDIKIPRRFVPSNICTLVECQLHHFSDASKIGYTTVSFLRMIDDAEQIHCVFIMGKCRNAPVQEWSVPRLELQAAVISSRLHKLIDKELELSITRTFFWSDSMTTLQYIKNKKRRFRPFVANRLSEIHDVSSPNEWSTFLVISILPTMVQEE